MTTTVYRELDAVQFANFRRRLLRSRGRPYQRQFLEAACDNAAFIAFLGEVTSTCAGEELPLHALPMTESEFREPPWSTEKSLYEAWSDLPARTACRTAFWADVTSRHVADDRIAASYLAANGGTASAGVQRLEMALQGDGSQQDKSIDDCVRTILRRLGGLPEARGTRTVYVDCPFGRAWWRERLVQEIGAHRDATPERVRSVLRLSQSYWEELVTLVVSRNSVLGSEKVRSSFILSLSDLFIQQPASPLRTGMELRRACRALGIMQATRELSVIADQALQTIIFDLVHRQHEAAVKRREPSEAADYSTGDAEENT